MMLMWIKFFRVSKKWRQNVAPEVFQLQAKKVQIRTEGLMKEELLIHLANIIVIDPAKVIAAEYVVRRGIRNRTARALANGASSLVTVIVTAVNAPLNTDAQPDLKVEVVLERSLLVLIQAERIALILKDRKGKERIKTEGMRKIPRHLLKSLRLRVIMNPMERKKRGSHQRKRKAIKITE